MTHLFVNYKQLYRQWPQHFGALATHLLLRLSERKVILFGIQSTAIAEKLSFQQSPGQRWNSSAFTKQTWSFSTHPRLWYLSPTLEWPQLFDTIKAKAPPDLNLEASVRAVTFISPRVLPWSSLACVLTWNLNLFSWVLFSFDFRKCSSTSTLLLTGNRGEWRRRVPRRSSLVIPSMWEKEMNVHCKERIRWQRDPCCFRDMFLQYLVSLYTQYFSQLHWLSSWSATNAW